MIIDAHTHIYPDSVAGKAINTIIENGEGIVKSYTDGTYSSLLSSMDNAGIDYSIVLPVATSPEQGNGILQWIRNIKPKSKRIIFFGSVHPLDSNYKQTIKNIKSEGLQGIKLHPGYQNFPADSADAFKIYEEALKNNLVLHFHSGFDPSLPVCDYTSIERFKIVLDNFPYSRIVLAHAGGMDEWQKVIDLLSNKGCFFDIAWVLERMDEDITARELYRLNDDYFLFGTDSPWCDQKKYVQLINNSNSLTQEQKDKLFFTNILKLVKIS